MTDISPCPICGKQPEIGRCEPWPADHGPAPFFVGCSDHLNVNGDDRDEAVFNWGLAVQEHKSS